MGSTVSTLTSMISTLTAAMLMDFVQTLTDRLYATVTLDTSETDSTVLTLTSALSTNHVMMMVHVPIIQGHSNMTVTYEKNGYEKYGLGKWVFQKCQEC